FSGPFALHEPLLGRSLAEPSNPRDILLMGRPPARTLKTTIFSSRRPRSRYGSFEDRSAANAESGEEPDASRTRLEGGLPGSRPGGKAKKPRPHDAAKPSPRG